MKQLAILIVSIMIIAGLWGWAYMFWISRQSEQPASAIISTEPAVFSDSELQSEVVFFLTKELGIYEGGFEVVDVARVDAAAIAGIEYLVVTMRAPDGRLCQVAVRKSLKPNAAWELDPSSFSVLELSQYAYGFNNFNLSPETTAWLAKVGVSPGEVLAYFKENPYKYQDPEAVFRDAATGKPALPMDWFSIVKPLASYKLDISKKQTIKFVTGMRAQEQDSLWKADYPDYVGAGYRSYLEGKARGK